MPHIIIKMQTGRSDEQKVAIAEAITGALTSSANCTEKAVSVSIVDVAKEDWIENVYKPDILGKPETLFKKPGYEPV